MKRNFSRHWSFYEIIRKKLHAWILYRIKTNKRKIKKITLEKNYEKSLTSAGVSQFFVNNHFTDALADRVEKGQWKSQHVQLTRSHLRLLIFFDCW